MLGALFTKVSTGWFLRRIGDVGGWAGAVALFIINTWNNMSPAMQDVIMRVLQGNWKEITLGTLPAVFVYVLSQVQSWRATTTPQVVTPAGNKIVTAEEPAKKPSILDRLKPRSGGMLERLLNR